MNEGQKNNFREGLYVQFIKYSFDVFCFNDKNINDNFNFNNNYNFINNNVVEFGIYRIV